MHGHDAEQLLFAGYTGRLNDDMVDQFMKDLGEREREVLNEAKNRRVNTLNDFK